MTTLLLLPNLFSSDVATIEGDAHHHLFRVRRLQAGDALRVVDGRGKARFAEIAAISKRDAQLALGERAPANEPERRVDLYVAAPKPERAAWLVEKATEVGVHSISFIATDRDARDLAAAQVERLRRIAISAVEQCGRSWLPPVGEAGGLRDAVSRAGNEGARIAVLESGGSPAFPLAGESEAPARIALFIGPEGGWSEAELELFATQSLPRWSLGPTVLRVETAAVVAAAIALAG